MSGYKRLVYQEEYSKAKILVRTCEDEVALSKCEGYCVSTTQPSAMERSAGKPASL